MCFLLGSFTCQRHSAVVSQACCGLQMSIPADLQVCWQPAAKDCSVQPANQPANPDKRLEVAADMADDSGTMQAQAYGR